MDACHGVPSTERDALADDEDGGASSISRAEPHFLTTQLGASRSVSPLMARSPRRFMKARKRGEESWYLSGKSEDGRIRYVWRAQVGSGGRMDVEGNVRRRVGWRPVGSMNAVRYVVPESCGERWCREGKEKRVGSWQGVSRSERNGATEIRTRLPTQLGAFANGGQKAAKGQLFWLSGFFACENTNFGFGRVSWFLEFRGPRPWTWRFVSEDG